MGKKILLAMSVVGLSALGASGQVHQVVGGNALDANPQVGVGGSNVKIQRGQVPDNYVNGNLVMSGNVAGLKSFQGNNPIRNMNEFQGNLGSATLNNFVRQSAGVAPTQTNQGLTQVYYNPNRLVSSQGGTFGPSPTGGGFDNKYVPGSSVSPMAGGVLPVNGSTQVVPINLSVPARAYGDMSVDPRDVSPLQPSGLFGFRNALQNPMSDRIDPLEKQRLEEEKEKERTDIGQSLQVGATTQQLSGLQKPINGAVEATPVDVRVGRKSENESTVYASMQKQLKEKQGTETPDDKNATNPAAGTGVAGSAGAANLLAGAGNNGAAGTATKPLTEEPDSKLTAGKKIEPITTFKGTGKSLFDQYMEIGERQLKEGRYIDAAGTYQNAMDVAGDNPLALVGRAHAQLAAGLYLAAGDDLKALFEKKPEMIAVRYDLRKFLPEKRIDFLISDVSKLARGKNANPTANFTLAYLDYQLGGREEDLKFTLDMWKRRARVGDTWPDVLRRAWLEPAK